MKIETLDQLQELANLKKAVKTDYGRFNIKPAAFMINLPGVTLLRIFKSGLYVYEKKKMESGTLKVRLPKDLSDRLKATVIIPPIPYNFNSGFNHFKNLPANKELDKTIKKIYKNINEIVKNMMAKELK